MAKKKVAKKKAKKRTVRQMRADIRRHEQEIKKLEKEIFDEETAKRKGKRKTIKFATLKRLSVCNSPKLPHAIELHGERREWVGIGWTHNGKPDGTEVLVICDDS